MNNRERRKKVHPVQSLQRTLWAGQLDHDAAQRPRMDSARLIEEMAEELDRKTRRMDRLLELERAANLFSEMLDESDLHPAVRARIELRMQAIADEWFQIKSTIPEERR